VTPASGVTVRVPSGLHGDVARHLPGGPTETLGLVDKDDKQVLLVESLTDEDVKSIGRAASYWDERTSVARSDDGGVQALWLKGESSSVSAVAIITELPSRVASTTSP